MVFWDLNAVDCRAIDASRDIHLFLFSGSSYCSVDGKFASSVCVVCAINAMLVSMRWVSAIILSYIDLGNFPLLGGSKVVKWLCMRRAFRSIISSLKNLCRAVSSLYDADCASWTLPNSPFSQSSMVVCMQL